MGKIKKMSAILNKSLLSCIDFLWLCLKFSYSILKLLAIYNWKYQRYSILALTIIYLVFPSCTSNFWIDYTMYGHFMCMILDTICNMGLMDHKKLCLRTGYKHNHVKYYGFRIIFKMLYCYLGKADSILMCCFWANKSF